MVVPTGHDADLDENFWAQAAAEKAEVEAAGGMDDDGGQKTLRRLASERVETDLATIFTADDDGGAGGFDTQFFHDDADADDYAMVDDGILGDDPEGLNGGGEAKPEEEDLWAGTQGKLKMARPESVHYAKKAKKVDVKRLKDNIWKGLKIEDKAVGLQDDMVSDAYHRGTGNFRKSAETVADFASVLISPTWTPRTTNIRTL